MFSIPRNIIGLTTFCRKKYLDVFLTAKNKTKKQPFELYEGPPEFLPNFSPVFIFQAGVNHRLRAIARFIGYFDVDGWRKKSGKVVADQLLNLYEKEDVFSHDTRDELAVFCEKKDGVRGLFIFDRIIEINYTNERNWIKKRDVAELFVGKQPYAQGFPFRYLSEEMAVKLVDTILQKAENSREIMEFLGESMAKKYRISVSK